MPKDLQTHNKVHRGNKRDKEWNSRILDEGAHTSGQGLQRGDEKTANCAGRTKKINKVTQKTKVIA